MQRFRLNLITVLLLLAVAGVACGGGGGSSAGGGSGPPTLSVLFNPSNPTIYPGVSFPIVITTTEFGTSATPTITLGNLPSGLSTTATFPMSVPAQGVTLLFTASTSLAPGSYSIPISGNAGTANASASVPITVAAGVPPPAYFLNPLSREIAVAPGSSASLEVQLAGGSYANVALSVLGLPAGVSASFAPPTVVPGSTFKVTLTASQSATPAQNVELTLTGTAPPNAAAPSLQLLLDVTGTSNIGWNNQTGYVSTRATPFSAVYDQAHQLIFAANQVWNRIDVISDQTRSILTTISIRDPRGMDLSVDGTILWIATGSNVMYSIDTSTLKATPYKLPFLGSSFANLAGSWEGAQVLSLADGTVFLNFSQITGNGNGYAAIWNPLSNAFSLMNLPTGLDVYSEVFARSGDGKRLFILGSDENETSSTYDVESKTFSPPIQLSTFGYAGGVSANHDGSLVAVADVGNGFTLYDGNLNRVAQLPGDGGWGSFPPESLFFGGFVFSADGTTIYEETEATPIPTIIKIDVATHVVLNLAPAMPVIPTFSELNPPFYIPQPFAVDAAGMILGIEYHGISFDDPTPNMNFSTLEPGSPTFLQHMSVYSGPLSGGTTSGGFGDAFSLVPDVYYGNGKGTATLSGDLLSITSPPATTSGPVDVKILFPDGVEVFNPQFFTYGTQLQDAIVSGGAPQGGTPAKLDAFGLPLDPSQDSVTIGRAKGNVTSTVTQYPAFTGEQTDMFLSYTTPAGVPGWADLTVTTPNGTSTLSKAFLYAQSVADYSMADSATFILLDAKRNQLYLSAGNHIDVFSLSSNSFIAPLNSPVSGSQFQGLALTPDGANLVAADLTNGGLAVINPDAPSSSYEISLPGSVSSYNQCAVGPLFVAADNQGNALVVTGAVVGQISCGPQVSAIFTANLAAKTTSKVSLTNCAASSNLNAVPDGSAIALTPGVRIYLPAQQTCIIGASPAQGVTAVISADGNVLGLDRAFSDSAGNITGRFGFPPVFYPSATSAVYYNYTPYQDLARQNPKLNDSGSLYYWAYPNYIDIVDVQHGLPALRFGLTETVTNTVSPMAIDSGGQHIYLITDKGLTVVDLGQAPLSIGHLSQTTAAAGTQVVIRGSGFENGITASIGGVQASTIVTDSNTLTLTVPTIGVGLQDLTLVNPDGKRYTLQSALTSY